MKKQTTTIGRVRSATPKVETFQPMKWLKESREWIISEILKYNSKRELVQVMTAIKEAVLLCESEHDALGAMDTAILTTTWSSAKHDDFSAAQRESLKRAVFN